MKTMLTIDPGMNTGWAYWEGPKLIDHGQWLIKHTVLERDLETLFQNYSILHNRVGPDIVYIEYPGIWAGSSASMAAAYSGDLIKLAAVVGGYMALSRGSLIHLIPPAKWMGQMSYDAIVLRVFRATGVKERSSHMNDAIGIGLHVNGLLMKINKTRPFQS